VKRSNRLVILVGVLLAVLAFVGIVIFLGQEAPPPTALEPETTTVLVATQDIEIGDPVSPDVVEAREVEPDAVVQTRLADPSQVRGQPALFRIPAGTQVTQEAIGLGVAVGSLADRLEPGEKAIAIQVERITGLDFLVQPGDIIDIVVSQQITVLQPTVDAAQADDEEATAPTRFETVAGLEEVRTVKTVLQAKRVIYVSDTRIRPPAEPAPDDVEGQPPQPETPIENVIIVFAGTDQDAEVIKFAQRDVTDPLGLGNLSVMLRHADDDGVEETSGITLDILVEEYGVPVPGIVLLEQLEPTP
jgi:pilus assembly protein CpaB